MKMNNKSLDEKLEERNEVSELGSAVSADRLGNVGQELDVHSPCSCRHWPVPKKS